MLTRILDYLKNANDYLSGEQISKNLNLSRSAVWKHIEELREKGYAIEAVPNRGYKLLCCPDKLISYEIQSGLKTKFLGKEILCYDTVDSTNEIVFKYGIEGKKQGLVVCAETQKKGKGRLGRAWISPKGKGIYMSFLLTPKIKLKDVAMLTILCAVAVNDAIKKTTGLKTEIKWPNDIFFKEKKLAGILTELSADTDQIKFVVIGIGINVNTSIKNLPENSTSIKHEIKAGLSRVNLIREVLLSFEKWYLASQEKGFSSVVLKWKKSCSTIGKKIIFCDIMSQAKIEGEAIGIDENGGLIIKTAQGRIIKKMSGDIIYAE